MLLTYGYKKLSIAKNVYMNSGFQISSTKVCSNSNTMSVNKMYWIHWNIRFVVQYYNDNHYNTMFSPVSELILCVWTDLVQRFVCVCVCVCMCACTRTFMSIHHEGFICHEQLECQGTDQQCCVEGISFLHQVFWLLL